VYPNILFIAAVVTKLAADPDTLQTESLGHGTP
jgi:hypothetical protein